MSHHDDPEIEPWDRAQLPVDLQRAFGSYRDLTPNASARAALLRNIGGPVAMASARSPRRTQKALYLALLAVVGGLLLTNRGPKRSVQSASPSQVDATQTGAARPVKSRVQNDAPVVALPTGSEAAEPAPAAPKSVLPERTPNRRRAARSSSTPSRSALALGLPAPEQELALLVRAKQVMAGDALLSLALTDEHEARFPHGVFSEEREVIAIESLLRTGQGERALARAAAFRAQYPSSPHLDRLQVVLQGP